MRSIVRSVVIALVVLGSCYESSAQIKLGGGFAYGTEAENLGITAKAVFEINDQWAVSPSFTYYFVDLIDYYELNADAHYTFTDADSAPSVYGLAGLNVSFVGINLLGIISETVSEVGLNVGGGVNYEFSDNISGYGELKYIISGFNQLVINVGVLFAL